MRPWGGHCQEGPSLPLPVRRVSLFSELPFSKKCRRHAGSGGWYLLISQRLHWQTQDKRCSVTAGA